MSYIKNTCQSQYLNFRALHPKQHAKRNQVQSKVVNSDVKLVPLNSSGASSDDEVSSNLNSSTNITNGSYISKQSVDTAQLYSEMKVEELPENLPSLLLELGANYDPDKLAAILRTRRTEVTVRAMRVAGTLGIWLLSLAADYAAGNLERNQRKQARQLVSILSQLGPSFVKIGQALSARPDLIPKTYLEELSSLQDRLAPFPNHEAMSVIEEELGQPLDVMFSEISEDPIAAASLGQVYRARLRVSNEVVAVKVQRPAISENIAIDMLLLRNLMGVVDKRLPFITTPIVPLVDEFARRLFAELDYVQEGRNAERFESYYGGMNRIRVPKIKWEATRRRVLCMEFIDGVKLTNKEAMDAAGLEVIDFVDLGIECTLRQLLEYGYFHADPHPGNLLATSGGDLVYLDFGMMSEAPEYARYAIIAHVVHLVNRDYEAMCRDYYVLEFMDRSVDTRPIAPALANFFEDVLDLSVSQLNFKALVDGLGDVFFKFPFKVPAYYALILRSLTVLEGLALQANPNYKLLAQAYPYMARRLLTDPAPELRESFTDLVLLDDGSIRWNRIQNLLDESQKSMDFDPAALSLLIDWILSEPASDVRKHVVAEMARLIDAALADQVRLQMTQLGAADEYIKKLVPVQPGEAEHTKHAHQLARAITQQFQSMQSSPSLRNAVALPSLTGSGPFNLPTPPEFAAILSSSRDILANNVPQLQTRLQQPGAQEAIQQLMAKVSQRFLARSVKFGLGMQQVVGLGGQS